MVQGELPTIDTGGEISSPNVPSGTGGTKSKSKYQYTVNAGIGDRLATFPAVQLNSALATLPG